MKINFLILGTVVVIATFSCTDNKKMLQMQGSLDSLEFEMASRDIELNEYLALISKIEHNISEIKEREKMITLKREQNENNDSSLKTYILDDLKAIDKLIIENKSNIVELDKKLRGSQHQASQFREMVAQLENRIKIQESEMETLNSKVTSLMSKNERLNIEVDSLYMVDAKKTIEILENEAAIEDMDEKLHAAYYASGTSQELINKDIINKEGGFIGIGKVERFNPEANKSEFTIVDIRQLEEIPVKCKKVEIVTNHPQESYEMVRNEDERQVDRLVILDPEKFWGISKTLVMVKK